MNNYAERACGILQKIIEKQPFAIEKARKAEGIPYTAEGDNWVCRDIGWWTNGFWPAQMWLLYLQTGDEIYRAEAVRAENLLDEALKDFENLHHDVGFMWLISSGVHYALEKDETSLKRLKFAGNMLAGRYNPNGFIRAWNDTPSLNRAGWSIIDTMMNLPLLYRMSRIAGDPRFMLMALSHAETALKNFYKPDGSVYHIVIYDPETGKVLETPAGQGFAPGSAWSRGQSWALYGFALSYLLSAKPEFLTASETSARYFIGHTFTDGLVPVDFMQPDEPRVVDNCTSAIAACGLIELGRITGKAEYTDFAARLVFALDEHCACYDMSSPAILTSCTGAYHDKVREYPMNYGDYFYIEALCKLKGETRLPWTMD